MSPKTLLPELEVRLLLYVKGFPGDSAGKESTCNTGDLGSIPGLGRFPWRRKRLLTPVLWPGEFHGLCSPWGRRESDTTERLSLHFYTSRGEGVADVADLLLLVSSVLAATHIGQVSFLFSALKLFISL